MGQQSETTHQTDTNISRRMFLFGRTAMEEESGVTAIEYGLIGGIVGVMGLMSLSTVSSKINENMRCTGRVIRAKKIGKRCKKSGF